MSHYYLIPYNEIPATYSNMQFASWSTTATDVVWSTTKPSTAPDGVSTFVVGITTTCPTTPNHATQLAATTDTKDPQEPPKMAAHDMPSFVTTFNQWVQSDDRKEFTLPADARLG